MRQEDEEGGQFEVIYDGDDRNEWLQLRREGIGASDAAGVLGVGRPNWSSPVSVFTDKLLPVEEEEEGGKEWLYWGKRLEPIIIEQFGIETGRTVEPDGALLRSKKHPFMQCTLDARQWDTSGHSSDIFPVLDWCPLEVKNSRFPITEIPHDYWVQMQHQLAVTGCGQGAFAVLIMGSQFFWADVPRDDEFIDSVLLPTCEAFWKVVENRGPTPPIDATKATLDAIKRRFPNDFGTSIALDGVYTDLTLKRENIQDEIKALKAQQQDIDNKIKYAIGDNSFGVLPNGRKYTYKANKKGVRSLRAPTVEGA